MWNPLTQNPNEATVSLGMWYKFLWSLSLIQSYNKSWSLFYFEKCSHLDNTLPWNLMQSYTMVFSITKTIKNFSLWPKLIESKNFITNLWNPKISPYLSNFLIQELVSHTYLLLYLPCETWSREEFLLGGKFCWMCEK